MDGQPAGRGRGRGQRLGGVGGRLQVQVAQQQGTGLAVVLCALFGPLGLWYLSAGVGLTATVLSAVVVSTVGLSSLTLLWPLAIAVAAGSTSLFRDQPQGLSRTK